LSDALAGVFERLMRRTWLLFSQAVTVALAVLFVVVTLKPEWLGRARVSVLPQIVSLQTSAPLPSVAASAAGVGYSDAARRASGAVVSITANRAPGRDGPPDDAWHRFFYENQASMQPQVGLGSGVILSPEGFLLTNSHVVEGADEIEVRLSDGRQAAAKLVGTDTDTDLAVLKIDLDQLPVVTLGRIESLQVGDVVLAIGNPFNVGQTVTAGIVSALGRSQLGLSTFENFIQTDAAINPGNSGGALVDAAGLLVGINTAIYSRSGGSLGIGFAIPVDIAQQVMEGLIRDGSVIRGWIGVEMRDITPEFAESFKLPSTSGVLIAGVFQNGPADAAGLQPGDVVTAVNDVALGSPNQFMNFVAGLKPQTATQLQVWRNGKTLNTTVTVGRRPPRTTREP
jgi:serine protease DegQ